VLLVDADLRRGRIHEVFNIRRSPGLAEVLAKDLDPDSAILRVTAGRGRTVDVMPSGECVEHPSALLGSPAFARLLESLRERYDLVVSDSPPVNLVSDALLIGRLMDSVVLVARAGITDVAALTEASRHLRDAGAPLLGVLLNDIDLRRDGGYDEAYRYLEKAGEYAAAGQA
jgi:tyrosine-protein kinase Etk/Wzc